MSAMRIGAWGLLVLVLLTGCGDRGEMDAAALSQQAKALQSVAAEGALLAHDAASGKSTGVYSGEHSAELRGAAAQIAASLEAATTTPGLDPTRRRLAVLGTQVTSYLDRIRDAPRSEDRAVGQRLAVSARRIQTLGRSLT